MASDDLMKSLLKIAASGDDEGVRLRAVLGALDRAGFGTKAELDINHTLKPFEQILQDLPVLTTISRGPSPDAPAVDPADAEAAARYSSTESGGHSHDIVDAEVVEDLPERRPADARPTRPGGPMETFSWDEVYGDDSPRPRRRGTSFRRG